MATSGGLLTIVHGVLGLFLIIELGLTGYGMSSATLASPSNR